MKLSKKKPDLCLIQEENPEDIEVLDFNINYNFFKLLNLSNNEFKELVNSSYDSGKISTLVNLLCKCKETMAKDLLSRASLIRSKLMEENQGGNYQDELKKLFNAHTIADFSDDQFADVYFHRFAIQQASSIKINFVRRRRMKQIGKVPDKWLTMNKRCGEEFAKIAGARVLDSVYNLKFSDVKHPQNEDFVIKPINSSDKRGAYAVRKQDIYSFMDCKILDNWHQLSEDVANKLSSGVIKEDKFLVQKCIYGNYESKTPANILRFHAFYGEIAGVQECCFFPENSHWFWQPDGELLTFQLGHKNAKPYGVLDKHIDEAKQLSLKIPSPYMRIDFLRGEDDIYFLEFCSNPEGVFDKDFILKRNLLNQAKYDRLFGKMYLEAEMQIVNDCINGKSFNEIREFNEQCEKLRWFE